MTLYVFAKITPKKEHYDDAKRAILDIIPTTLAEKGCLQFDLLTTATATATTTDNDTETETEQREPRVLFLQEAFSDNAALEYHHEQEYTKAVFTSYKQWLAQPVEIFKMIKLSA